jgi:hypothetical protein
MYVEIIHPNFYKKKTLLYDVKKNFALRREKTLLYDVKKTLFYECYLKLNGQKIFFYEFYTYAS